MMTSDGICAYGRASNTRLNGVVAAVRKRVKPPLWATAAMAAGPAWAPSDSPPLWLMAAGTQIDVGLVFRVWCFVLG